MQGQLLMTVLTMTITSPDLASDRQEKALLRKAQGDDVKTRAFAIGQLRAKKIFKHNALFVDRLKTAPVDAQDVGPIFMLWEKKTPPGGEKAALDWLARATTEKRWSPEAAAISNLRSAAIWIDAHDRGDAFRDFAVKLTSHPDLKVVDNALRVLERHRRKKGHDDAAPLLKGFAQHESLELRYVRRLGETGDRSVVAALARAGVKAAEANPNHGAPDYVAALRKLSPRSGKHPKDWLPTPR